MHILSKPKRPTPVATTTVETSVVVAVTAPTVKNLEKALGQVSSPLSIETSPSPQEPAHDPFAELVKEKKTRKPRAKKVKVEDASE